MEIGKELGHFRESIILRGARKIDPDAELEQKISVKEEDRTQPTPSGSHGSKGKGKEKGKEKGKAVVKQVTIAEKPPSVEEEEREEEGGGAVGVSMSADGSENGQVERPRSEDRYGFLYSISEADLH